MNGRREPRRRGSLLCPRQARLVAEGQEARPGPVLGMSPEIDTATALRAPDAWAASSRRAALRPRPAVSNSRAASPRSRLGLQLERRLIQTSEPNLDERVAGVGSCRRAETHSGAEAATVIARDLAAQLERLDRPLRIHAERTAGLLSAIRAVATPDMHRVTANGVANRPAETSAVCVLLPPPRRWYAALRCASVRECPPSFVRPRQG